MEANFGFGKLVYPTDKIEEYIEPFKLKYSPENGWDIFQSDTNVPDEKYVHPTRHVERYPYLNIGYYLQTQHIDDVGKLKDDYEADIEGRKSGFIIDEYGVVQGYGGRNLVFEANPDYVDFLIGKITEEPTIYGEIEKTGYVPKEIKKAFPELARSNSSNMWNMKTKNNEKYMKTSFEEFLNEDKKKSKDPIIQYKKEKDKFYKQNPSGGKWVEITKREYEQNFLNESVEPGKWFISYGLSGGFGGANNFEVIDAENEDEASSYAWEKACQEYDDIAGLHGLRDIDEIMEEEDCDAEEAEGYYNEERESWIDYSAEPYDPEKHDEYL